MIRQASKDLDYVAANLHGRRNRMAEGGRLDSLLSLKTLPELGQHLAVPLPDQTAIGIQQHLVQNLATEIPRLTPYLTEVESDWVSWTEIRFHLENLKMLIRAILSHQPPEQSLTHWLDLDGGITLDAARAIATSSLDTLATQYRDSPLGKSLKTTVATYRDPPRLFLIESALDRDYFIGLLERTDRLSDDDRKQIRNLVVHEVDTFLRLLALRGRIHYDLAPSLLASFHIPGTTISKRRFLAMLNASGASINIASEESAAWRRYLTLADTAFRRSHIGFGVVAGYIGLRRMEVANLIMVSEGIRSDLPRDTVRAHLVLANTPEPIHV